MFNVGTQVKPEVQKVDIMALAILPKHGSRRKTERYQVVKQLFHILFTPTLSTTASKCHYPTWCVVQIVSGEVSKGTNYSAVRYS